jgi:hypothetical protein
MVESCLGLTGTASSVHHLTHPRCASPADEHAQARAARSSRTRDPARRLTPSANPGSLRAMLGFRSTSVIWFLDSGVRRRTVVLPVLSILGTLVVAPSAWASPPGMTEKDEGLVINISFRGIHEADNIEDDAPIAIEDRIYYCNVALEAAESIWTVTHGQHYIWKVHFFDGFPPGDIETRMHWYHKDYDPRVEYGLSDTVGQLRMYDVAEGCVPEIQGLHQNGSPNYTLVCPHDPNLDCAIPEFGDVVVAGELVPDGYVIAGDQEFTEDEIRISVCIDDEGRSIRMDRMNWAGYGRTRSDTLPTSSGTSTPFLRIPRERRCPIGSRGASVWVNRTTTVQREHP